MKIGYLDCIGGASGDMFLGALVDAGLPVERLGQELGGLALPGGFQLGARRVSKAAIQATYMLVDEGKGEAPQNLREMLALLDKSDLSPQVKERSEAVLRRLATAEGKVHGLPPEEVPLHETRDLLIDVVGGVLGLSLLGIEKLYSSSLPTGSGLVRSHHGILPIPAPATLELLALARAPLRPGQEQGEVVTPTGAALITTLATFGQPAMTLEAIGYGAGSRDLPNLPNVLALWLGEVKPASPEQQEFLLLETNIDDMNPELYGYLMERLFQEGARDAWFTPIQMKKGRPAVKVSVLATREREALLASLLLRETTTLGVRVQGLRRYEAEREELVLQTSLGPARVKLKRLGGVLVGIAPEYEDCRRLAQEQGLPLQEVYRRVSAEAEVKGRELQA